MESKKNNRRLRSIIRLAMLTTLISVSFLGYAKYTIHSLTGKVKIESHGKTIAAKQGLEVEGLDQIVLEDNSSVEIMNSADSKIYKCSSPGKYTATKIMLNAKNSSSSSVKNINNALRFSNTSGGNSAVYQEGCRVTRALEDFDPEASSLHVDSESLGSRLAAAIKLNTGNDSIPFNLTSNDGREALLEFTVDNPLSFPIYVNIVKYRQSEDQKFHISEIGQPVGCYTLLPNQTLMRRHSDLIDTDEQHILIAAYSYFDIDKVLEKANALINEDTNGLPIINGDLYITKLN